MYTASQQLTEFLRSAVERMSLAEKRSIVEKRVERVFFSREELFGVRDDKTPMTICGKRFCSMKTGDNSHVVFEENGSPDVFYYIGHFCGGTREFEEWYLENHLYSGQTRKFPTD